MRLRSGETLSAAEYKLLKALDPSDHWLTVLDVKVAHLTFCKVLEILGHKCFIEDRRGPEVDALRRALRWLQGGKYRGELFDAEIAC